MGLQNCTYNTEEMAIALGVSEPAVQNAMRQSMRGGFARVWTYETKTTKNNKEYARVELSTSKKRRDGSGYDTDFQSKLVTFVGEAYSKLCTLNITGKGVSIQITSFTVTRSYNKETKQEYTNYTVYDFEIPESNGSSGYNGNRQNGYNQNNGYQRNNGGYNGYQNSYAPPEQKIPVPDDYEEELPF